MKQFKDHFSKQANQYAAYRPRYPIELYQSLASLCEERKRAWDCATGNGQAAHGLVEFFDQVIATDGSENQIANAAAHKNIRFEVSPAEKTHIKTRSINLVTVAQALHWFELEAFYAEVNRVLKPGGILAVWSYNFLYSGSKIDGILHDFYHNKIGSYWPPERSIVEAGYQGIYFPFKEIPMPRHEMEAQWDLSQLLGYLGTWSAVQRYKDQTGENPLTVLAAELTKVWGASEKKYSIKWPLSLKVGRV